MCFASQSARSHAPTLYHEQGHWLANRYFIIFSFSQYYAVLPVHLVLLGDIPFVSMLVYHFKAIDYRCRYQPTRLCFNINNCQETKFTDSQLLELVLEFITKRLLLRRGAKNGETRGIARR